VIAAIGILVPSGSFDSENALLFIEIESNCIFVSVSETHELSGVVTMRYLAVTDDLLMLVDDDLTSIVALKQLLVSVSFEIDLVISAYALSLRYLQFSLDSINVPHRCTSTGNTINNTIVPDATTSKPILRHRGCLSFRRFHTNESRRDIVFSLI
jgi:hypothetical protein